VSRAGVYSAVCALLRARRNRQTQKSHNSPRALQNQAPAANASTALFGDRLEALEFGTAARHGVGVDPPISLPKEACCVYRDAGPSSYD